MTAKEVFPGDVEAVVVSCLIPVQSAPLRALSEAVAAGTDDLISISAAHPLDSALHAYRDAKKERT